MQPLQNLTCKNTTLRIIYLCFLLSCRALLALAILFSPPSHALGPIDHTKASREQRPQDSKTHNVVLNGEDISLDPAVDGVGFVALVEGSNPTDNSTYLCVGVAIAADMVLTAGHCLSNEMIDLRVKFISNLSPLDYETISAKDFIFHPMYNAGHKHKGKALGQFSEYDSEKYRDIGIILLEYESNYAEPITVAPLDLIAEQLGDPQLFFFGRGRDDIRAPKGNVEFARIYNPIPMLGGPNFYKSHFASRRDNVPQSVCAGDSGGPVTITGRSENDGRTIGHYLLGVFSFRFSDISIEPSFRSAALQKWRGESNIPGCGRAMGFINVLENIEWIEETMNKLDPKKPRSLKILFR